MNSKLMVRLAIKAIVLIAFFVGNCFFIGWEIGIGAHEKTIIYSAFGALTLALGYGFTLINDETE